MTTRQQILGLVDVDDVFDRPNAKLVPMRLEVERELVDERRQQITVLQRRAHDAHSEEVNFFRDLLPLSP